MAAWRGKWIKPVALAGEGAEDSERDRGRRVERRHPLARVHAAEGRTRRRASRERREAVIERAGGEPISDLYLGVSGGGGQAVRGCELSDVARPAGIPFIMGSSMGGLISLYAVSQYPDVFYGAGCVSAHWAGGTGTNSWTRWQRVCLTRNRTSCISTAGPSAWMPSTDPSESCEWSGISARQVIPNRSGWRASSTVQTTAKRRGAHAWKSRWQFLLG
ncbi:MAG: alpha/beta hydrolase-fold protein [Ignavibacteriales bacterium]|nr:alpha/beta hydrolase-fold protein [Ignavibacteriales bacterium]